MWKSLLPEVKKKKVCFNFPPQFGVFSRGGRVRLCFVLLRRHFWVQPRGAGAALSAVPGLADGTDPQVPTRAMCKGGALCFCQPGSSPGSHNSCVTLRKCFLSFFLQMLAFRHRVWGLRMGLPKLSLRSGWKSWLCVRQLLYLKITVPFNSWHWICVHSAWQLWLKTTLLMKMGEINFQSLHLVDSNRHLIFFHEIWFLLTLTIKNTKWLKCPARLQWQRLLCEFCYETFYFS